jgi:hypothetical protein
MPLLFYDYCYGTSARNYSRSNSRSRRGDSSGREGTAAFSNRHRHHSPHVEAEAQDDTAHVQQLQDQYRQEFVLRQARRQSQARASAPPAEFVVDNEHGFIPVLPPPYIATSPSNAAAFDEPDIEVMYHPSSPRQNNYYSNSSPTARDFAPQTAEMDDFEYARHLQMEIEREERMLEEARQ